MPRSSSSVAVTVDRRAVVRFRWHAQQLDRETEVAGPTDVALLDYGVQDTGGDGAAWALALRGATAAAGDELALAWTLRGAPHVYRRADLAAVALATAPYSEADAAKRVFDAQKGLRAAGIPILEALARVADELRDIAAKPISKGDASTALTGRVDAAFVRPCRACKTEHAYEQLFRLAALQGGLVLAPDTSPPVLRRAPRLRPNRYRRLAGEADARVEVIRNHLRFYGPARQRDVAAFIDAPQRAVSDHWPDDAVEVAVDDDPAPAGGARFALAEDVPALADGGAGRNSTTVRLLGSHDAYLQLRDRELLVDDADRRADLWRVLGRPGAAAVDGEVAGTWRPRTARGRLTIQVEPWTTLAKRQRQLLEEQAERLAAHRGVPLAGVTLA